MIENYLDELEAIQHFMNISLRSASALSAIMTVDQARWTDLATRAKELCTNQATTSETLVDTLLDYHWQTTRLLPFTVLPANEPYRPALNILSECISAIYYALAVKGEAAAEYIGQRLNSLDTGAKEKLWLYEAASEIGTPTAIRVIEEIDDAELAHIIADNAEELASMLEDAGDMHIAPVANHNEYEEELIRGLKLRVVNIRERYRQARINRVKSDQTLSCRIT